MEQFFSMNRKHLTIVLFMCLISASSIGLCMNSVGVFFIPVSASLNVLRGSFALQSTLSSISTAIISLFMPKAMIKTNYKKLFLVGVLMASTSTALMAFGTSLVYFYILGIIRGLGVGIFGTVPVVLIINKWFHLKTGVVLSIASSFSGLSAALFSPLLSHWINRYGWRTTYILMAIIIILLVLPALLYPWSVEPRDSGVQPFGSQKTIQAHSKPLPRINQTISVSFILMCFFTIQHTSITGISQHFSGIVLSSGLGFTLGPTMMSLAMIGNIVTKLVIGSLSDKYNPVKSNILMIVINQLSLLLLTLGMNQPNYIFLLCASFLFGSVYAVGAVGIPILTKHFFGVETFPQTYAIIGFLTSIGSAASLTAIGYIYDFSGGYTIVTYLAMLIHTLNICIILLILYIIKRKDIT